MSKFTDIKVGSDGIKRGYYKSHRQWVILDDKNNIVKEIVNDNGQKSIYFDNYGYQPHTFKEHLDENGKADVYAQLDYCKSVDCPDCYYCIWIGHMHLPPRKIKSTANVKKDIKKTKSNKWDKLAKSTTIPRKINNDPNRHPLYDKIVEKFCK
jgi:hypothetical protein